jgi:hypothetical protein
MEVNKAQWPEGTTVDLEGYYSPEGEMLNSEPHTQEFVDAWNGVVTPTAVEADIIEEAVSNIVTEKSSKAEMETEARKHGLELDRRQSKKSLWGKLKKVMK